MQVLAFISGKGGVGKSTLTANVAVALAQRGKRVLVIDLDPQNAQGIHLGIHPDETAGLVREGISHSIVFDSPFGVQFVPFGVVPDAELEEFREELLVNPDWVAAGIDSLSDSRFDYVLLDTPPGPNVFVQQAMRAAHRAVVLVLADAASVATLPQMQRVLDQYTAGRSDYQGMFLLINQLPVKGSLGHQVRQLLARQYADVLVPVSIHRDEMVGQALAYERPVLEYEPGAMASLDVQYLADWLEESAGH
jgi:cellulose synthase operon protein YhjQ